MNKKFILIIIAILSFNLVIAQPVSWSGDTDIDLTQETTDVHAGSSSLNITVNSGTQANCDLTSDVLIPVTAGNNYTIALYAKTSLHVRVRVVYTWTGASTGYSSTYAGDGVEDPDYVLFTDAGTVPAGATGLNIGLRCYDQAGFVVGEQQLIDDITFESPTGTPLPVTNGDFELWPTTGGGATCAEAVVITEGTNHAIHTVDDALDQWYQYVAPFDGEIIVENCASDLDTYLQVIENNCSGTNWDESEDDCGTGGSSSTITFTVAAGESYFIGWQNWEQGTTAEYDWTLTFNASGGGATCAAAVLITEGTQHAVHTVDDALDQWYVFVATVDGEITVENCASDLDTYLQIIENNCSGTNWDESEDDCGTGGSSSTLTFPVTTGESYFIGWQNWDQGTTAEYDWTITENEIVPAVLVNAYALSDDEIDLEYDISISAVDPADYNLSGSQALTFTSAVIDGGDDHIVHLSGASSAMTSDFTLDNIDDDLNGTSFDLYAGITSIMYTNNANDPDTIMQGYNATFTGIVSADDEYNNVWVADNEDALNGVMVFDYDFDGLVNVGDEITFVAQKDYYFDLTELVDPILLEVVSSGNSPYGPSVITGNVIDTLEVADSPNAEQWEGQLVTINNTLITESGDYYFYGTDDCEATTFEVGDNVDYQFGNVSMDVGSMYNITGVVDFSYGFYRINPRDASDISEIDLATSTADEPGTQTPGATLDVTVVTDSLSAAEVFRFVITDDGTDGLPTMVSQITFYEGANNTANFDSDIAAGYISFDGGDTINYSGEPTITSGMIQLMMNSDEMIIADGSFEEFVAHIWLDGDAVNDHVIQFTIDADNHGFLTEGCSSQFNSVFSADIIGNDFTIDNSDGVNSIIENNVTIHPNPAKDVLNINNMENISEISIINLLGQTVQLIEINSNDAIININELNKGMYLMNFKSITGEVFSHTFVKH